VADADEPLTCAECGREPRDEENAADEWRAYLDVYADPRPGVLMVPGRDGARIPRVRGTLRAPRARKVPTGS
jgi:hypothetical protein